MEFSEDIGGQIIQELEKLSRFIDGVKREKEECEKNFPNFPQTVGEKKNRHLHINMGESLYESLRKVAKSKDISMSEYCRRRLRGVF